MRPLLGYLAGKREPETLRHITTECPWTVPVVADAHQALIAKISPSRSVAALPPADFIRTFVRRIICGVNELDATASLAELAT